MKRTFYFTLLIIVGFAHPIQAMQKPVTTPVAKPAATIPQLADAQKKEFIEALNTENLGTLQSYLSRYPQLSNVTIAYFFPYTQASYNYAGRDLPIMLYAIYQNKSANEIKTFLDAGANVNSYDPLYGEQALTYAIFQRSKAATPQNWLNPVAKLLIERGADLNYQDAKKRTPLIWAAEAGLADIVELMVTSAHYLLHSSSEQLRSSYLALLPPEVRKESSLRLLNASIKDQYGKNALNYAIEKLEAQLSPKGIYNPELAKKYEKIIDLLAPITKQ